MKRKKPKIELRYYYMPAGSPILPLLGERWVQNYGTGIEDLHFHNFMEIGFCYYGEGILTLGEEKRKFTGRQFTVIPERFPHTTNSMGNTVCKWEYLFVDVEGFLRKNCESAVQAEKMLRRINAGALLMNEKEASRGEAQPCIRCAKCVSACPMGLEPFLLATLSMHKEWERVEKEDIMSCIECGSCQFTCPSHRPMLDYIRLGKGTVGGIIRARNAKK